MKKLVAACAALALVAAIPAATAVGKSGKSKQRAHVFKANIGPVVYGADQAYSMFFGRAQLVDNKRRDKVSIHMRGLKPGTTYPWHVHAIADPPAGADPCAANAPQGGIVNFTYRPLKANPSGNASSTGRSRTFRAVLGTLYYVNVHDPVTQAPIACGILRPTRKTRSALRAAAKKKAAAERRARARGKARGPRS